MPVRLTSVIGWMVLYGCFVKVGKGELLCEKSLKFKDVLKFRQK